MIYSVFSLFCGFWSCNFLNNEYSGYKQRTAYHLPGDFLCHSAECRINIFGLFIAWVESAHYLLFYVYNIENLKKKTQKKQKKLLNGIHHTVVVVDFLKIAFCGFGAVGGGTVAGLRGEAVTVAYSQPPFSSGKGREMRGKWVGRALGRKLFFLVGGRVHCVSGLPCSLRDTWCHSQDSSHGTGLFH